MALQPGFLPSTSVLAWRPRSHKFQKKSVFRRQQPINVTSSLSKRYSRAQKTEKITFFDTTLRDGLLHPHLLKLTFEQRISIAHLLLSTSVDVLEVGHCRRKWPVHGKRTMDENVLVELATHFHRLNGDNGPDKVLLPELCALTDLHLDHIEAAAIALELAPNRRINMFARVSDKYQSNAPLPIHTLQTLGQQVTKSIEFAVKLIGASNGHVQLTLADATHAHNNTIQYITAAAVAAGALTVVLADTAGVSIPSRTASLISLAKLAAPEVNIGFHAHNDLGLAVPNAVCAVAFGANHVEGTIAGIGPRNGNLSLEKAVEQIHHLQNDAVDVSLQVNHNTLLYASSRIPLMLPSSFRPCFEHGGGRQTSSFHGNVENVVHEILS